ncbi:hypothetical protein [Spirosoma fluminis]
MSKVTLSGADIIRGPPGHLRASAREMITRQKWDLRTGFLIETDNHKPLCPMPPFDLETQNYAQMDLMLLHKLKAALKNRVANPKTNWEKSRAPEHYRAISEELYCRKRLPAHA